MDCHSLEAAYFIRQPGELRPRIVGRRHRGKTPTADGRSDQHPLLGHPGQPVAKDGPVQARDAQRLGAAGGTGDDVNVLRRQGFLLQPLQRAPAGAEGQGRRPDVYGGHGKLPIQVRRV